MKQARDKGLKSPDWIRPPAVSDEEITNLLHTGHNPSELASGLGISVERIRNLAVEERF